MSQHHMLCATSTAACVTVSRGRAPQGKESKQICKQFKDVCHTGACVGMFLLLIKRERVTTCTIICSRMSHYSINVETKQPLLRFSCAVDLALQEEVHSRSNRGLPQQSDLNSEQTFFHGFGSLVLIFQSICMQVRQMLNLVNSSKRVGDCLAPAGRSP